ncbi:hypothetical protein BH11PSE8_BH11PSE8_04260 [soil metagenome]
MKIRNAPPGLLDGLSALLAFVLALPSADSNAQTMFIANANCKGNNVQSDKSSVSIPPDLARYLEGPTAEGRQFEFLIGKWDVDATKFDAEGSVLFRYRATWRAGYLNDGRMVMDEFVALSPDGRSVSSYVTLRTYSETTRHWEMVGLAALQPAAHAQWYGVWTGDEMQLDAAGVDPEGRCIRTKIRFSNITVDRFLWESASSADEGRTWARTASLVATRVAGPP